MTTSGGLTPLHAAGFYDANPLARAMMRLL